MDYVGIPYEKLDCYGLCRFVLKSEIGLELPEIPPSPIAWPRYIKIFRTPPWDLRLYDVLMFSDIIPGLANHIGVVVSNTDFVHSGSAFGGSVCEPVRRWEHKIIAVGRPIKP